MNYSELNSLLKNLKIKTDHTKDITNSTNNHDNSTMFLRDLHLNNNVNNSLELANPQRNNISDRAMEHSNVNNKLSDYRFNIEQRPRIMTNTLENINISSRDQIKQNENLKNININDKISNREKLGNYL